MGYYYVKVQAKCWKQQKPPPKEKEKEKQKQTIQREKNHKLYRNKLSFQYIKI